MSAYWIAIVAAVVLGAIAYIERLSAWARILCAVAAFALVMSALVLHACTTTTITIPDPPKPCVELTRVGGEWACTRTEP